MSLLRRILSAGGKKSVSNRDEEPAEQLHPWDGRMRLLSLGGSGDYLCLSDMFTGLSVTGATGSGKTSTLALLAVLLMKLHCGFVWLCAKPDEVQLVRRLARRAGREADLVVIGEDADGRITNARFNPLEYEAHIAGLGTGAVVKYLADCHRVLSHREGEQGQSGEGERFWNDQFERLLRYCIDTAKFAGRALSVDLLRKIQLTAPISQAQLADDNWAAKSVCWQCLIEAETRVDRGEVAQVDHDRLLDFWTRDYPNFDAKPRSTIDVMFASLVDSFYAEEPLRSILTTTTNISPDDVINKGSIVCLSLPTSVYLEPGRMAQFCFKYSYQRAMLRRRKPDDGAPMRPTVLWADEAHNFAHAFDAKYFSEVRSNRGVNVWLEQGIGGYMDALGVRNKDQIDRFLQNLATKFFFQNDSHLTNVFAADVIGKRMLAKFTDSSGWGSSENGTTGSGSESVTEEERYQVLPGQFSQLRRGGPDNALCVDAYVTKAGTTFCATGTNFLLCTFKQTELTR